MWRAVNVSSSLPFNLSCIDRAVPEGAIFRICLIGFTCEHAQITDTLETASSGQIAASYVSSACEYSCDTACALVLYPHRLPGARRLPTTVARHHWSLLDSGCFFFHLELHTRLLSAGQLCCMRLPSWNVQIERSALVTGLNPAPRMRTSQAGAPL